MRGRTPVHTSFVHTFPHPRSLNFTLTLFHAIVQGEAFFDALDVDELACPS